MKTILVVDDSEVDRRIVGGLLRHNDRLNIEFAEHGAAAMERLADDGIDLILTDLVMPEMDGLQLVSAVRSQYPLVPVILMTSQGSEQIAAQALTGGAASYVPKKALERDLLETVDQVLSIAGQQRSQARLIDCLSETGSSFTLDNDGSMISQLVGYLQEHVIWMGVCDESQRVRVGVALEEALSNAIYHGNLEISSDLREHDNDAYQRLIEERRSSAPYRDRRVSVEAHLTRDELKFTIQDEGPGFDPHSLPDPTDPANLEKASGRGVFLMRTFMDEVQFNDQGNRVVLSKRRESDDNSNGHAA